MLRRATERGVVDQSSRTSVVAAKCMKDRLPDFVPGRPKSFGALVCLSELSSSAGPGRHGLKQPFAKVHEHTYTSEWQKDRVRVFQCPPQFIVRQKTTLHRPGR